MCVCVKRGHVNSNGAVSTEMGPLRKDRYHISFYIGHGTWSIWGTGRNHHPVTGCLLYRLQSVETQPWRLGLPRKAWVDSLCFSMWASIWDSRGGQALRAGWHQSCIPRNSRFCSRTLENKGRPPRTRPAYLLWQGYFPRRLQGIGVGGW